MTGTVLGERYVLGAILGKGGMGLVHQAVDLKLQREVAVKLFASAATTTESLRRFSREALAAGSLQHPNVVGVFDTGEQQGRPFLVTELLRGETMRQRLARGPIHFEQARSWALQLAAGLSAAHEKGLIHRDLKPSNVFITTDGWVKILDFGLVKLSESLPDLETHRPSGTVGYMAPEQVRGQPLDVRADLFNFGLVLYEMLGGERAFAGGSATETSYAIVLREPAPLPDAVPLELRRVVSRCLAKDRERRPASARELLEMLQARPQRSRARRWWPAAVLLLPLLAAGVLVQRRLETPARVEPGSVAIFPFEGVPAQTALADGLSDLLNIDLQRHLNHAGDLDSERSVFARTGSSAVHRGRSAALELNARHYVLGKAAERDGRLSIEAALYETETGRMLVSTAADGSTKDLLRLVRRISDGLFEPKALSPAETARRQQVLERKTTSSIPALVAWMEGQWAGRHDEPEETVSALKRAAAFDPEFALGQYELGRFTETSEPETGAMAYERALALGDRLSSSERTIARMMVLKWHGHPADAQAFLLEASRAHPEDLDILRLLAEYIYHRGPLLGRSPHESAPYFHRLLELDPLDFETSEYLMALAALRGQRTVVAHIAGPLLSHATNRFERVIAQLYDGWARGDAAQQDAALAELRKPDVAWTAIRVTLTLAAERMDGSNDAQTIAALSPVGRGHQSFQPRALANLLGGHVAAARRDVEEALAAGAAQDTAYYLPWIDTLDFVSPSPAQLAKARAAAARLDVVKDPTRAAAKEYLLGMLALRANDPRGAAAAVAALETLPEIPESTIVADHALALRARILAAQGDAAAALTLYDQQKIRIPERYTHFYRRPRDHFFRAALLVALGRPREALPLYEALAARNLIDPVFYPGQQLYTARVYDSLGEQQPAIDHYQRFVAMWHDCDPEERPEVDRARARLAELLGEKPK